MKRLPPLSHLKEVYVNGRLWYDQPIPLVASTLILLDDTVLKNLEPLKDLQELRVHQTRIPGNNLAGFTSLKFLDLNYDRSFNDRGAASLKAMTGLTKLYLRGTSVTDAGLRNL